MKKKNVITEKYFRVGDHKVIAIRMITENDNPRFEIEQVFSDEIIPHGNQEQIMITGASLKIGLEEKEFFAILNTGMDFVRLIKEQQKKIE